MAEERNKSYRIRTKVGSDKFVSVQLNQDYDTFDILSLSIKQDDTYKLHNANYGVIVGRVLANNGFGIPNAKVSVFIEAETEDVSDEVLRLYPYASPQSKGYNDVRYNLLPNEKVNDCYQVVGDFPTKSYLLANDVLMEVFDKYYKLTAKTNEAGDYMIAGVPTGQQKLHMDLDLSDCGILSQKPRDFVYKGYNIDQFESPSMFKSSKMLDSLSQIIGQDKSVYVYPFWGTDELGETIGITRCDIDVNFKFEPTAVFIGSVVSDPASNGISKRCVPTNEMGRMDQLTTGKGRIEMIRKTPGGDVETFVVKGNELINGDGVWCYQVPMNLDYVITDEFGNMVPTDDASRGIPTRTRCRFRMSMEDFGENNDNYFRGKVLVPHNPQNKGDYDYVFGTKTHDDSYRDLLWNNVYTVKQYIPRFQKSQSYKSERFTGIKGCNHHGSNNPMPYNNLRIRLPFMFRVMCALIKAYVRIVTVVNNVIYALTKFLVRLSRLGGLSNKSQSRYGGAALSMKYVTIADGLCPDLENWYFAPNKNGNLVETVFSSDKASGSMDGPNWSGETSEGSFIGDCYYNNTAPTADGKGESHKFNLEITGDMAKYFICFTKNSCVVYGQPTYEEIVTYDKAKYTLGAPGEGGHGQWVSFGDDDYVWVSFGKASDDRYSGNTGHTITKEKVTAIVTGTIDGNEVSLKDEFWAWCDKTRYQNDITTKQADTWWNFALKTLHQGNNGTGGENGRPGVNLYNQTIYYLQTGEEEAKDEKSIDNLNADKANTSSERMCITKNTDFLISCIEMNLAQEYRVINFDFYNDWVNGVLYFPRWMMQYRPKKKYFFNTIEIKAKTRGCIADNKIYNRTRRLTQQCAPVYDSSFKDGKNIIYKVDKKRWGGNNNRQDYHKNFGKKVSKIFGDNGGVIKQQETIAGENVYYYKPCEWNMSNKKVNLFATDLVLLGSLNECSRFGIPMAFKYLTPSSYKMPTNLALTNMDDDGYLYANTDGSYCTTPPSAISYNSVSSRTVTQASLSYSATAHYYSSVAGGEEYIGYGKNDNNYFETGSTDEDFFAITEAAGIAWNYTGPGQGKKNDSNFYQPGGHFLGLSCNNSQTNLKTCINVQRICEIGASMSQRHERVMSMSATTEGEEAVSARKFLVPTGLINDFDITGAGFRAMFATMNMKPLICDTLDEETSYKKYSFIYNNPNGFDGTLSELISKATNYNAHSGSIANKEEADEELTNSGIAIPSESSTSRSSVRRAAAFPTGISTPTNSLISSSNGSSLTALTNGNYIGESLNGFTGITIDRPGGITGGGTGGGTTGSGTGGNSTNSNDDNEVSLDDLIYLVKNCGATLKRAEDYEESYNTYRQTKDNPNEFYHRYRLGLSALTRDDVLSKYLLHYRTDNDDEAALPQYENSFYFYFGLHDGSTAFDEFLSQFFSECPTDESSEDAYIALTKTSYECSIVNSFVVTMYNMDGEKKVIVKDSDGVDVQTSMLGKDVNALQVNNLNADTYTVEVYESDDQGGYLPPLKGTITFNKQSIVFNIEKVQDLTYCIVNNSHLKHDRLVEHNMKSDVDCGYIEISNEIELDGEIIDITKSDNVAVLVYNPSGYTNDDATIVSGYVYSFTNKMLSDEIPDIGKVSLTTGCTITSGDTTKVYVGCKDVNCTIYIQTMCGEYVSTSKYCDVYISGIENINIYLGSKYLPYKYTLGGEGRTFSSFQSSYNWWETLCDESLFDPGATGDNVKAWAAKKAITNQNPDSSQTFNVKIYAYDKKGNLSNNFTLFGQPENAEEVLINGGCLDNGVFSNSDYSKYRGYELNDNRIITECLTYDSGNPRTFFGKMCSSDKYILSNGKSYTIQGTSNGLDANGKSYTELIVSGSTNNMFRVGHGLLLEQKETIINCLYKEDSNDNMVIRTYDDCSSLSVGNNVTLHQLFFYPAIYSPFHANVYYYCLNNYNTNNRLEEIAFCDIYNGITFGKRFGGLNLMSNTTAMTETNVSANVGDLILSGSERKTQFGYNADCQLYDLVSCYNETLNSFYIKEGCPDDLPSEINEPYKYVQYVCSGKTSIVFADKIRWSTVPEKEEGEDKYVFKSEIDKRDDKIPNPTKDGDLVKYYAVYGTINLPFDIEEKDWTFKSKTELDLSGACKPDEYVSLDTDKAIPLTMKEDLSGFDEVKLGYEEITAKLIIGVAQEVSSGNNVTMIKFYKNGV